MDPDEVLFWYYSPDRFVRLWILESLNHPSVVDLNGAIQPSQGENGLRQRHSCGDTIVEEVAERTYLGKVVSELESELPVAPMGVR